MPPAEKKLLIIDDEQDLREILKVRFENAGYLVCTAAEGGEGFKKVLEEKPGCILLDVRIKEGEDGLSFLRRLRSYRCDNPDEEDRIRETPVIVLTASGETMKELFDVERVSDYFTKPFDSEQLKQRIEEIFTENS